MFSWWCGSVFVVVFLWWCSCRCVCVVVFLWWCFCAVFLWCGCGGVFVVVYKSITPVLQSTTPVLQSTTPVLLRTTPVLLRTTKYYSSTTPYYKVLLQYYKVLTPYYSKYYSSTTLHNKVILQYYYKVLLQYYSVLQSTTPTSETTSERRPSSTTPYYASTTKASKTSISCEASATFHRKSFQNEHFARCFLQISQNKLPKRAFRARLPQLFTEKASKTSISRDASSKFHRTSFQNERFARCFRQFSQKKLPKGSFRAMLPPNFTEQASKTSVSRDASSKFHKTSFQNDRFVRGFLQISQNNAPKTSVSRDASDNFHQKFAFRYSFA